MSAVAVKHVECVRALLPFADPAVTNRRDGASAFHVAVVVDSEACVELLLPMMSNVDVRTVPRADPNSG